MIIRYLLILGIGHLLGDFYFQNETISKYKEERYKGILLHSLEYYIAAALVILPVFSLDMFLAVTFLALAHFIIDTLKFGLLTKKIIKKSGKVFVIDQCMHAISIFVLAYIMDCRNFLVGQVRIVSSVLNTYGCNGETLSRWFFAVLLLHIPANLFIQNFLEEYRPKADEMIIIKADHKVGRRIGTVERFIMIIFLSKSQYAAIGFILTAKSVARYDKITKDEKFAEYYLLGTLVSTLCSIICRILII